MKRLLMIDDEKEILDVVKTIIEDMGYIVDCYDVPEEGLSAALANSYDLIVTDIRMPGMNGAEITEKIRAEKEDAVILLLTGYPGDPVARRALEAGAVGLMRKPFEVAKIVDFLGLGEVGH